jgi:HrpA-like RNA helicase
MNGKTDMVDKSSLLPIFKHKDHILESVMNNPLTIISGDTGCGKTTQVPKYIFEKGLNRNKLIAVTQPRRISAISVSERVAYELQSETGKLVGFEVRFESCLTSSTVIKFMTEGVLMREYTHDNSLSKYSVIIIDEAHERGVNCDFLIGLTLNLLRKRKDIRVVVMSATLETEKIVNFFKNGVKDIKYEVITVEGRYHPIEIMNVTSPAEDYVETAFNTLLQINFEEGEGDVLAFFTGQVF